MVACTIPRTINLDIPHEVRVVRMQWNYLIRKSCYRRPPFPAASLGRFLSCFPCNLINVPIFTGPRSGSQ